MSNAKWTTKSSDASKKLARNWAREFSNQLKKEALGARSVERNSKEYYNNLMRAARAAERARWRSRRTSGGSWYTSKDGQATVEEELGYFRFVDTRIRRLESAFSNSLNSAPTGVRRTLKDALFRVGQDSFIFPFVESDGDGGVFAEWKAGNERIELAVEGDGEAYARVSYFGEAVLDEKFDPASGLPEALVARLRGYLSTHTANVTEKNPDWRRYFVAG